MRQVIFFTLLVMVCVCGAARADSEKPALSIREPGSFTISKGQVLYQRYCLFCHGESGKGDGQNAFSLLKRPGDFAITLPQTGENILRAVIRQGGQKNNLSGDMPSFGRTLSENQIQELFEHLQTLLTSE